VPKNAVIMAAVGDLGLVAIAQQDIVINQQLHAFVCLNEVFYEYIAYWIEIQKPYMFSIASKTTIPYLNKNNCESIPVNYPPLPEQQKIAQILSTWDKAISTTEQLLANSQQQKKALMQQLLTGKKRLLDEDGVRFSGEWLNKLLGEICEISTGKSNREDSTSSSGLYTFFDRSQDIRTSNIFLFETEAVIVAGEGQEFVPKYFSGKFDLHQRTYAIMGFANSWGKFIYFYLWHFNSFLLSQAVGSTVKSLRLPMFQKMPIKLPSLKEQQKIATALSSAECEIKLLQTKLEALKQEKKALMQQLLTGKRRVNII
jgi:type I restriction enzyme S subunit